MPAIRAFIEDTLEAKSNRGCGLRALAPRESDCTAEGKSSVLITPKHLAYLHTAHVLLHTANAGALLLVFATRAIACSC